MQRGEVWWASLPGPRGSEPGRRRPVLVVQSDAFNRSLISTVVVVVLTTNVRLAAAPGNVGLTARQTGLPKDSVANVSQILTLDRSYLTEHAGQLPPTKIREVDAGLLRVLGLGIAKGV